MRDSELQPIVDPRPKHAVAVPSKETPPEDDGVMYGPGADAATLLIRNLFTPRAKKLDGIEYAVEYHMAQGDAGGDIVDVYLFDNGSVAFSVCDISGKGARAALHAALVRYALRAYASAGSTAENTLQLLNRLYIENSGDEGVASFATVFFGHVDHERRVLAYASAAHDTVFFAQPGRETEILPVTAPMIGVFDTQVHLFRERLLSLCSGTILVVVTDGITDARRGDIEFLGLERVREMVETHRDGPMPKLAADIITEAEQFWGDDRRRDDMAVLAVRFL